jgi:hypothetical protein
MRRYTVLLVGAARDRLGDEGRAAMRIVIATLLLAVSAAVAGCGASTNHCITRKSTGQKYCGHAAVAYCEELKPLYRGSVLSGRTDMLKEAELARHICKERTGVDISR